MHEIVDLIVNYIFGIVVRGVVVACECVLLFDVVFLLSKATIFRNKSEKRQFSSAEKRVRIISTLFPCDLACLKPDKGTTSVKVQHEEDLFLSTLI